MNKKRQSLVLSRWFTVDHILFGNNDPKSFLGEDAYNNYITAKGAFLSGLHDIYMKLGYDPKTVSFKNLDEMKAYGEGVAKRAKKRAKNIITTESVASAVRNEVKSSKLTEGITSEQMQEYLIDKKIKSIALDVVMLESALAQTGNKNSLKDFSGKVLLSSYKIFRDSVLKYAY